MTTQELKRLGQHLDRLLEEVDDLGPRHTTVAGALLLEAAHYLLPAIADAIRELQQ